METITETPIKANTSPTSHENKIYEYHEWIEIRGLKQLKQLNDLGFVIRRKNV